MFLAFRNLENSKSPKTLQHFDVLGGMYIHIRAHHRKGVCVIVNNSIIMKQKLFTFFFALVASVSAIYAQSGKCGSNLTWMLDAETGVLTISGMGTMNDFDPIRTSAPWIAFTSVIRTVIINDGVTSIGDYAFDSCSRLTSVTIPNSVTSIGGGAFYYCSGLTSITIPNSVTSIGYSAFEGCSSLTSITIPESVTSIEEIAFGFCESLTSITIPNSVTSIEMWTFAWCSSLTSVTIGNSVTSIGEEAFAYCSSLTSITIPKSVKTIGASAFEGCARLGKISLGTGLEEIAANAFAGCTRLYDIYVYATYPPFAEESSFANYNAYLYIPCESKRDYTMDPVWSKFQNIECLSDEPITGVENIDTPSQATTNCQKIIRDGNLVIIRDGVEYTVMGQEM